MIDRHKLKTLVEAMRGKCFVSQAKLLSAAITLEATGASRLEFLQNLPANSHGYLKVYGVEAALDDDMEAFMKDWLKKAEKKLEDTK